MSGDLKERIEKTPGIAERVARGAAWLDERIPDWWREHSIDLDRFDMSEECRCVIGQLSPERNYERALATHWLDLSRPVARDLGFFADAAMMLDFEALDDDDVMTEYDELQHAWTVVIRERREAAGAER